MLKILLLPQQYLAARLLKLLTVRIHSAICVKGNSWARLWYLLRALDVNGSGNPRVSMGIICQLLGCSSSTIYEWLREGQKVSAFTWYRYSQRQGLRVRLGSLHRVCQQLDPITGNIAAPWGVTAEVPLHEALTQLRTIATTAVAQKLQQRSRYAAWRSLPARVRRSYKLPKPEEFFLPGVRGCTISHNKNNCATSSPAVVELAQPDQVSQSAEASGEGRLSHNLHRGSIRYLIHIGPKRIFVSKGFVPFGASQPAIAWERGYCERTIQRHIKARGTNHRQVVQSKAAYGYIMEAMHWDAPSASPEPDITWNMRLDRFDGSGVLREPSGRVGKPHTFKVKQERFFRYGERPWFYRCNLYEPTLKLCSMRASIRKYRRNVLQNRELAGGISSCSIGVFENEGSLPN